MIPKSKGVYGQILFGNDPSDLLVKQIDMDDEMSIVRDTVFYTNLGHTITIKPTVKYSENKVNIQGIQNMGLNLECFLSNNRIEGHMLFDFLKKFCSSVFNCFMAGMVQGDCKPDNICIKLEDGVMQEVNLIDGTLCKHILSHTNDISSTHSTAYRCPEGLLMSIENNRLSEEQILQKDRFKNNRWINHEKAQIWAMGCTLMYVITQVHVFATPNSDTVKTIEKIFNCSDVDFQHVDVEGLLFMNDVGYVDLRFVQILKQMLCINPKNRIGLCELINLLNEDDMWKGTSLLYQISSKLSTASQIYQPIKPIKWEALNHYLEWIIKYKKNKFVPIGGLASSLVIYQDLNMDLQGCTKCIKYVLSQCLVVASYLMSSSWTVIHPLPLTCHHKKCSHEAGKVDVQHIMSKVRINMWKLVSHPFHLQMYKNYQRPENFHDFIKPTAAELESIVAHNFGVSNPFIESLDACDFYHYQDIVSHFET
jgi:hypothetical protein